MKLMNFSSAAFRSLMIPMVAALMLGTLAVSCSKEEKLLDAVPAEVDNVGMLRLKSTLEQAGFKFGADKVTTEAFDEYDGRLADLVDLAGALDRSGVCDINRLAWAKGTDGNIYLTALVADEEKLIEATAGEINWESGEKAGYRQGTWRSRSVLAGNGRLWITDAKDAVGAVSEFEKKASKSPLTALTGICQALEGEGLMNMAVRRSAPSKSPKASKEAKGESPELESLWATFSCDVKDNKLVASSVMMEADGKVSAVKGLKAINPAVLGYVPETFTFAFAIGLTPEFDWSVISEAVGTFGGFQARGMLAAATPYLQSIDGTVMLAAGPANDQAYTDIDPGNWQFVLMAHLPQEKVNQIMNMVRSSMFMAGISPRMTDEGVMIVPQYGMNLYLGSVDGYFAVSNIPFDSSRQNSLAPLFTGKDGALTLELPSLRSLNPSAPAFGMKLNAQTGEGKTTAELALTETDLPILQAILAALI